MKSNDGDSTDQTEAELRQEIRRLAQALVPFPEFLGLSSVQAVEVEPVADVSSDVGCVVVCPDGELRELVLRLIPGPIDFGGVEQNEEMKELELDSADYIKYARAAVAELKRILAERAENP
ncbi:MAG: hypothetical protein IH861_00535 [Chloroflexi bacterium]|nr:hypothetical protein [Chloroflexota bacterium]